MSNPDVSEVLRALIHAVEDVQADADQAHGGLEAVGTAKASRPARARAGLDGDVSFSIEMMGSLQAGRLVVDDQGGVRVKLDGGISLPEDPADDDD